ncbi:MAG TPA: DUF433 domain-containing protein [Tepidisphaeraceae bacterium]|jgi:uncharacterized protein (DUF433 family)
MVNATEHPYVTRDDSILSGEPIIKGTRTPVRAIVENWRMGVAPEDIPTHLPHLTLAQVFDALSYFADHQEEIIRYIERNRVPDDLIDPRLQRVGSASADGDC